MKYKVKLFSNFDIYYGEDENGYTVRRKIYFFYSIPIWCTQYKVK
jgi:hypothetical protein